MVNINLHSYNTQTLYDKVIYYNIVLPFKKIAKCISHNWFYRYTMHSLNTSVQWIWCLKYIMPKDIGFLLVASIFLFCLSKSQYTSFAYKEKSHWVIIPQLCHKKKNHLIVDLVARRHNIHKQTNVIHNFNIMTINSTFAISFNLKRLSYIPFAPFCTSFYSINTIYCWSSQNCSMGLASVSEHVIAAFPNFYKFLTIYKMNILFPRAGKAMTGGKYKVQSNLFKKMNWACSIKDLRNNDTFRTGLHSPENA